MRNRPRPEGSIAEGYLSIECLTFCSMYLCEIETVWSCEEQNSDRCQGERDVGLSIFSQLVRPLRAVKYIRLDDSRLTRAQWYVLSNCSEIDLYKT